MRIAYFSPLPPARTGIAAYSSQLLHGLSPSFVLDCFHDDILPDKSVLPDSVRLFHYQRFPDLHSREPYDLNLYQLGNSRFHMFIYYLSRFFPGLVDLHDVNLHHMIAHVHSRDLQDNGYVESMSKVYGEAGARLARMADTGLYEESQTFLFPLSLEFLTPDSSVIVHSEYASQFLRKHCPHLETEMINPPHEILPLLSVEEQATVKESLGLHPPDQILICSFGEILGKKGCFQLIEAMKILKRENLPCLLVFVGCPPHNVSLDKMISDYDVEDVVRITRYVPDDIYYSYLQACDLGVNLRFPSVGETSQTLLELMARGKPVITTNVDQGAELPDSMVLKVGVSDSMVSELIDSIRFIFNNPDKARDLGNNAREHIRTHHQPGKVYPEYTDIIRTYGSRKNPEKQAEHVRMFRRHLSERLVSEVGASLADSGFTSRDSDSLAGLFADFDAC